MNDRINLVAIVPVYNTAQYLPKCLDSLIGQTMREILIIVVNDGSTDNSQAVIDEYAQKFPEKVKGFVTENLGIGMARNYGIDRAVEILGTNRLNEVYVSFVDSDDWLEVEAFELLYKEAVKNDADIVLSDFQHSDGDKFQLMKGFWGTDINDPYQRIMNAVVYSAWDKIYRISLFNDMRFPATMYEDVVTIPIVFRSAQKVSYLPVPLYNYSVRTDSTSHTVDPKQDLLKAIKFLLDYGIEHHDEIILKFLQRSLEVFMRERT